MMFCRVFLPSFVSHAYVVHSGVSVPHLGTQRPKADAGSLLQSLSILPIKVVSVSGTRNLPISHLALSPPSEHWDYKQANTPTWHLGWFWESKLPSCL